ncbi:MAG: DUF5606 domain-containing protein [Sinomicrobium sp.]|nr:DUF5606 domain-containing protein [Sinomicrobium sp.]
MDFENILTISGKPGLFELKSRTRTGFVVEALEDGKRSTVNSMRNEVRLLAEIAIYTLKEEMPLKEVLRKISAKENGQRTEISHKDDTAALEAYFFEIVPDYDEDKVYPSHIKKIIQWYNILQSKAVAFESNDEAGEEPADDETGKE